jgi:hypothetical protein
MARRILIDSIFYFAGIEYKPYHGSPNKEKRRTVWSRRYLGINEMFEATEIEIRKPYRQ